MNTGAKSTADYVAPDIMQHANILDLPNTPTCFMVQGPNGGKIMTLSNKAMGSAGDITITDMSLNEIKMGMNNCATHHICDKLSLF